jgi:hypothetical protein
MISEFPLTPSLARRVRHFCSFLKFALLVLLLTSAGCATQQMPRENVDLNRLLIADLPSYQPGEFFIYDNGMSMIATESANDSVNWRYGNGAVSSGYRNFLVPQISWESNSSKGRRASDASPNILWPLSVGKSARFGVSQTLLDKTNGLTEEINRRWECNVKGTERISVPAGNFDTYIVSCDRYSSGGNEWRGRHTYYFSPDVRHYVKLDRDYANRPSKSEQLVRYGFHTEFLTEEEQAEAKKLLFQVLDKGKQGVSRNWVSPSGHISVMLIPYQRFTNATGQQCREYKSVFNVGGRVSHHNRKACHAPDGTWQRTDN